MHYQKTIFTLALTLLLTGCSTLSFMKEQVAAQFRKFSEPPETSERARIRIFSNSWVTATPNSTCMDMSVPGAGTIFGGILGTSGYRNRSLNMPPPKMELKMDTAEFYVAAGQPVTLHFLTGQESPKRCAISISFVPGKDQDYEAAMFLDTTTCKAGLISLTQPDTIVPVNQTTACGKK